MPVKPIENEKQPTHELEVHELSVKALKVDPKNVRLHSERNIGAIMASLLDHGQVEPILIQKKTNRVIAGHGRLEAAMRLGMTKVKVIAIDCDAKTAKILGVRLNKTAELGAWDFQGLSEMLSSFDAVDQLRTGFTDFEIGPLLSASWEPPAVDDTGFEKPKPESDDEEDGGMTLKLSPAQAAVLREAMARNEQKDPLVFLIALCQLSLGSQE